MFEYLSVDSWTLNPIYLTRGGAKGGACSEGGSESDVNIRARSLADMPRKGRFVGLVRASSRARLTGVCLGGSHVHVTNTCETVLKKERQHTQLLATLNIKEQGHSDVSCFHAAEGVAPHLPHPQPSLVHLGAARERSGQRRGGH